MNAKRIVVTLFALLAAVQLAIPALMAAKSLAVLSQGELVKFRTSPVDPYDFMRGRYVALDLEALSGETLPFGAEDAPEGQTDFFAVLAADPDGFAYVSEISIEEPDGGTYLALQYDPDRGIVNPFDKYFLNQKIAPLAEESYRSAAGDSRANTYVTVRIKEGQGVIQGLFIDGTPIEEYVSGLEADGTDGLDRTGE